MKTLIGLTALMLLAVCGLASGGNLTFLKDAPAAYFDADDTRLFEEAVRNALETSAVGEITGWNNEKTGHFGKLKVLESYEADGSPCRRLQIANKAGGQQSNSAFHFCKQADGAWKVR